MRAQWTPWEISKAFENSAGIGDFVPLSEAGEIQSLSFRLNINGQTVQRGETADMIFSVDQIVSYASRFFTLKMGDLIYTGTPAGVGPVSIGDHLQGYLGERKVLDFFVR